MFHPQRKRDISSDQEADASWTPNPVREGDPFRKGPVAPWRVKTANWLSLMALGCFVAGPVLLALLHWEPAGIGNSVLESRSERYAATGLLLYPIFYSFILALFSLIVNFNKRAAIVMTLIILFFVYGFISLLSPSIVWEED
jgi:hypothetical protein